MKKTAEECSVKYFEGDELATKVFLSKYAGEDEKTPDNMHQRLAYNIALIERKYQKELVNKKINIDKLSDLGRNYVRDLCESNDYQIRDKWFQLFKNFKYIVPGGSIMASLGKANNVSLANCFVIDGPKDKMESIMDKGKEMAYLFMRRGGVGTHLDYLRPNGAMVNNASKTSTGAASFMEYYSTTVKTIGQNGRRGALMLCMSDRHPDIKEFITMKHDLTKVTGANVSVKVSKELLSAYKNNEDWLLKWPINSRLGEFINWQSEDFEYDKLYYAGKSYFKKVKAVDLFELIITSAWKTAEPGILLWDNMLNYDPASVYPRLKAISTNPCVTGDTKILTDKGYVRIDSLVGKKTNVWNGYEWSEVVPKITGTNQEILKIKFSDGNELKVTPYHKFILKDKSRTEAKNLKVGDSLIKCNFPVIEGNIESEYDMYTQGFYSGDGSDHKEKPNERYIWLYGEKNKLIPYLEGKIIGKLKKDKNIFNAVLCYEQKDFVPDVKYTIKNRIDWLAGLIDSDGTFSQQSVQISSINKEFLLKVKYLLNTLGCNCVLGIMRKNTVRYLPDSNRQPKLYATKTCYRLNINSEALSKLKELGLKTHRVKIDISPNRYAGRFVKVVSVEKQNSLEDKVYCFTEYKNHSGIFNGVITAQCGEQPLGDADSCRLSHINLLSFVKNPFTNEASFDYELFRKVAYEHVIFLDDIIDLECKNVENIINHSDANSEKELWSRVLEAARKGRRIGCGFTALGDTIAAMNLSFKDSHYLVESIMETKFKAELEASIDLAYLRGTFLDYDYNLEYPEDKPSNQWYEFLINNYPKLVSRMKELGRRNVSLSTVAPVGSGSLLTQTTSGIEPVFKTLYDRRVKVNAFDEKYDFVDPNTKEKFKVFTVAHKGFQKFCEVMTGKKFNELSKSMINTLFKSSPYYNNEAADIPWQTRLEIQAIVQKYTTSSISTTINLASDVSRDVVENIYLNADKMGLKGVTTYVDGSRSGVLVSTDNKIKDPSRKAPKRPSELLSHIHNMKVQGKNYLCALGFYEGKPYEIFVCPTPEDIKLPDIGKIVKIKKGYYQLQDQEGKVIIENFIDVMDDQLEMITRILSISIRSDVGFNFLIDQLKKSKGELTAFHKVLARTIAKYVDNNAKSGENCPICGDKLVFNNGCLLCKSCSFSKCS